MNQKDHFGLIADDFTGAMDTGAQFAKYGFETSFALHAIPPSSAVVLNTASREIAPQEARERCQQAVRRLEGRRLFKKIDSLLRGHISAEIHGLASQVGQTKIVVCSTSPHQRHVIKDGLLYVQDTLVHESIFRLDPAFPTLTSSVAERVGQPSTHLALNTVHQPIQELVNKISTAPAQVVTVDAITAADLLQISRAIVMGNFIPCGGAGMAHAWAQTLSGAEQAQGEMVMPSLHSPLLIISGSANPKTVEQIEALAGHPESLVWKIQDPKNSKEKEEWFEIINAVWSKVKAVILCPGLQTRVREPEWLSFHHSVSCLAVELLHHVQPAAILIAGGETANYLCNLLEVQAVELAGEALPGIPYGTVCGGLTDQITLLTKAGGNGQADCLEKIVYGINGSNKLYQNGN
jgi:uncharacterized protein YgbK (DUF1537 family)